MKTLINARAGALALGTALFLATFALSGCYEDYDLGYEDFDTQTTFYTADANFPKYKYFVMPDTVMHIYDTTKTDPVTRKFDKQILQLTKSNFEARGYIYLGEDSAGVGARRDSVLAVFLGAFSSTFSGYYYDYWYPYWGYWYGWGYYPPYYPGYVGTYEYTVGTLLIEGLDYGRSVAAAKRIPVWFGAVRGLAGDTPADVQLRISNGINQIFVQSPYLTAGQ